MYVITERVRARLSPQMDFCSGLLPNVRRPSRGVMTVRFYVAIKRLALVKNWQRFEVFRTVAGVNIFIIGQMSR